MISDTIKTSFLKSANKWVYDGYSARITFIAGIDADNINILEASIGMSPIPPDSDNSFLIKSDKILIGQIDIIQANKKKLITLIEDAVQGTIQTSNEEMLLYKENNYSYYSESSHRGQWYYELHLSITGRVSQIPTSYELADIDNLLRISAPPFDGLYDAATWLGLNSTNIGNNNASITIRISPPTDLVFDQCKLNNDTFKIAVHAHRQFNTDLLRIAIIGAPGNNLKTRLQIASKLKWNRRKTNKLLLGKASVKIKNSDSVIAMVMIGNSIVRRQWFLDLNKARNNRLMAIQSFDKDLKMIRNAVFDTTNSLRFENGIAALLFLLGFSPCVQIETDSPDLIVQTPNGRIILVECTVRIADFSAKLGKLVDRKGILVKELEKNGHSSSIVSMLVCRLPRDQIAAQIDDLIAHKTILIAHEYLHNAFNRVRFHNDPDKILEEAEAELNKDAEYLMRLKDK